MPRKSTYNPVTGKRDRPQTAKRREIQAGLERAIPDDYTGVLPPGMEETLVTAERKPGRNFPTATGRVPVERGLIWEKSKRKKASAEGKVREWQTALKWALREYQTDKVDRGAAIRAIALMTIDLAIQGDKDARAEIANRLDGKAIQQVEQTTDHTITVVHRVE